MSTPIPEWARQAAIEAAGPEHCFEDVVGRIALALLARDERAAKIAEIGHWEHGSDGDDPRGPSKAVWTGLTGPEIASAIRGRIKT